MSNEGWEKSARPWSTQRQSPFKTQEYSFRQSGQVGTKGNWGMILSLAWLHGLVILIGRRQRKLTQTPGLGKQQKYA